LTQQRFKNLQPPPIVVTANDLGVVKINPMVWVGLYMPAHQSFTPSRLSHRQFLRTGTHGIYEN